MFDYAATVLSQGVKDNSGNSIPAPSALQVIRGTNAGKTSAVSEAGLMRALKVSSGGKISTKMAQRIIWSYVATNGSTSAMSLKNAPKSWRQAVLAYNKLMKGK